LTVRCLLIAAAGAAWEAEVLKTIEGDRGLVLLKRCVDVTDLMGAATTGQVDVAVVALDAPGLDAVAVDHLRRHQVGVVGIDSSGDLDLARLRASRVGIRRVLAADALAGLAAVLAEEPTDWGQPDQDELAVEGSAGGVTDPGVDDLATPEPGQHSVTVVWGPQGAPGRTTLAVALAAELAARGGPTVLVDADPWGGAVAQHLGILDEVSGILSATRLATSGELRDRAGSLMRTVGEHLHVVTGLPRPDRWSEVRPGTVNHLVEVAVTMGEVVVDTGFCLEEGGPGDFGTRPPRNSMTLGALEMADTVVAVGTADPVGLARLARGLVEVREVVPTTRLIVVINRMRDSVGWSTRQIASMVEGFARYDALHFVPEERAATDRALLTGEAVRGGALGGAVADLADVIWPAHAGRARGRLGLRWRTAGTSRRR
ncbi:MAG: hypothetical protein WAW88_16290, partial [Nocardioides sp.]